MNVDLPNLTSINSKGSSFCSPRLVRLESTFKLVSLIFIEILSLQSVYLPDSFQKVQRKSISSNDCLIWFLS